MLDVPSAEDTRKKNRKEFIVEDKKTITAADGCKDIFTVYVILTFFSLNLKYTIVKNLNP